MATSKATKVSDLTSSPEDVEKLTASAVDPSPTRDELVEQVEEATDQEMVADTGSVKYVKMKDPFSGTVSTVPESIVDALLESGYTKSK